MGMVRRPERLALAVGAVVVVAAVAVGAARLGQEPDCAVAIDSAAGRRALIEAQPPSAVRRRGPEPAAMVEAAEASARTGALAGPPRWAAAAPAPFVILAGVEEGVVVAGRSTDARQGAGTEVSLVDPVSGSARWRRHVGDTLDDHVVTPGRVVVAGTTEGVGWVAALDVTDGSGAWCRSYSLGVDGEVRMATDPHEPGSVVVAFTGAADGRTRIDRLGLADGRSRWSSIQGRPVRDLVVGHGEVAMLTSSAGRARVIDGSDGHRVADLSLIGANTGLAIRLAAASRDRLVTSLVPIRDVVVTVAVDRRRREAWRITGHGEGLDPEVGFGGRALVHGGTVLVADPGSGWLRALDMADGRERWRLPVGDASLDHAVVAGDRLVLPDRELGVRVVDLSDGTATDLGVPGTWVALAGRGRERTLVVGGPGVVALPFHP